MDGNQDCPHLLPAVSSHTGWSIGLLSHGSAHLNEFAAVERSTGAGALMLLVAVVHSIREDGTGPRGDDGSNLDTDGDLLSTGLLENS